jgi:hypothetical protein
VTGNYKLYVKSYKGSGSYWFDLSCANASSIVLSQNQFSMTPGDEGAQAAGKVVCSLQPTLGTLAFSFDLRRAGQAAVSLYDGAGREVRTARFAASSGHNYAEMSTVGLRPGVYFYRFESPSLSRTGKVTLVQ